MVYTIAYRKCDKTFDILFPEDTNPRFIGSMDSLAEVIAHEIPEGARVCWNISHQTLGEIFHYLIPEVEKHREN